MRPLSARTQKIIIILLLSVTFFVRVYRLDHIQFDSDFGRDSLFGLRMLTDKISLLGAQASVGGFYLGPFYFYSISALFAIFGPIPEVLSISFALLNVLAAWMGYKLLSTKNDKTAGNIFLILFCVEPLLVTASRMATHAPMLPAITIASLLTLTYALKRKQLVLFFIAGLTLGLFFHVHFSALLLFPGMFLSAFLWGNQPWKDKLTRTLVYGIGAAILLTPLVLFDVRHKFITSIAFFHYIRSVVTGGAIRDNFPHWSLFEKIQHVAAYLAPQALLSFVVLVAVLIALLYFARHQSKNNREIVLIPLLTLSVLFFIILYPGYLFEYYMIVPGTLVVLTAAIGLSQFRYLNLGVLIAIVISLLSLPSLRQLYSDHFRTLGHLSPVVSEIESDLRKRGEPPFEIYKVSSDNLTGLGYEYRFLLTRDGYVPVHELQYPEAKILYLIREEGTDNPLTVGGYEIGQFGPHKADHVATLQIYDHTVDLFALQK